MESHEIYNWIPGACLTKAYDVTIWGYRNSHANYCKMPILRCLGSKLCVRFQRCPLKFYTKFCTHTQQNMHLTRCYKNCRLMKSHSYDPLKCVVKLLNDSQTSLPASLKFMNGYVISPTLYIWYNNRETRLLTLYSVAQYMICIHISTAMIQLRFCPPWHVINLCNF